MAGSQGQPFCASVPYGARGSDRLVGYGKKLTGSDVHMLRDMLYLPRLQILHKHFVKIILARRQASQCPVCTIMIILTTFKNVMRPKGYSTDIYVAHVLPRMIRSVFTVPWIAKPKIQK